MCLEKSGIGVWLIPLSRCWEVKTLISFRQISSLLPILGLTVGSVFSLALFKRRMWPVTFGLGAGFGMGYANCEHELNEPYMVHIKDLKKLEE